MDWIYIFSCAPPVLLASDILLLFKAGKAGNHICIYWG